MKALFIALSLLVAVLFATSLLTGPAGLPVVQSLLDLVFGGDGPVPIVMREIRLPRAILGLAVGAGLGLTGAALDVVRDTVTDFIPMRSWVRRLSGAEQHSRRVRQSIEAGLVRRSFLKGVGLQRSCRPPAAPLGVRPLR